MQVLGPALSLVAIATFVFLMLLSCALSIVWPVVAIVLGLAMVGTFHFWLAWAFLRGVPAGLFAAWDALVFTSTALLHPLRPVRHRLPLPSPLPHLHRMANEVAEQLGEPPISQVFLQLDGNFGVLEIRTKSGLQRVLLAGAALLFVLHEDELRAVLAHEMAHFARGHVRWIRVLGRWREMVEGVAEAQQGRLHPVAWGLRIAAWVLRSLHTPWARSEEFEADRIAASVAGATAVRSALRRAHEEGIAVEALVLDVAEHAEATGVGPESLCEAALRRYRELSPAEQQKLRRLHRPSPFDVDGQSHPPLSARLAALKDIPRAPAQPKRAALARLPDVQMHERQLTQRTLGRVRRWVPARAWAKHSDHSTLEAQRLAAIQASFGSSFESCEGAGYLIAPGAARVIALGAAIVIAPAAGRETGRIRPVLGKRPRRLAGACRRRRPALFNYTHFE